MPPFIHRNAFLETLNTTLLDAAGQQFAVGLILIDLANLSDINRRDSYATGDEKLSAVGEILVETVNPPSRYFRIASHTFAIVVPKLTHASFIAVAASRLQAKLNEDPALNTDGTPPTVRIGTATASSITSPMVMLAAAENDLHGRTAGTTEDLISADGDANTGKTDPLYRDFVLALNGNGLDVWFQPKVSLPKGHIAGAEALLRWQHPEAGFVSPERILRMAEFGGHGFTLTKYVANKAIRHSAEWHRDHPQFKIAINLSANLLQDDDLPSMLQRASSLWQLPTHAIILELTEQAVMSDFGAGMFVLGQLRERGFSLSIDDFGTGYSSLSYLQQIPARELKIDRSFVCDLINNERNRALTKIIINTAQLFEMKTVAEGVEDLDTILALKQMGCDKVQGYYVAKPMPAPAFSEWMANWQGLPDTESAGSVITGRLWR